jgi:nucleoside-diphosphate-sugar epimerase
VVNILVTGGAGYVGSTLTEHLLQQGHRVRVLDNLKFNQWNVLIPFFRHECFEFQRGDIRDKETLKQALVGMDVVVHLAAIVGFPACDQDPLEAESVNLDASRILNMLRHDRPLIFASTGSVYGKVEDMCDETVTSKPLTRYGITKLRAEESFLSRGNICPLRFATAFGLSPRMRLDLMPNSFTYELVVNKTLTMYQPHARRTFIHVQDMARAICHALANFDAMKNQVYNVGDNRLNCTKRELVDIIKAAAPDATVYDNGNGHDPDMRDYAVEYKRLNATGFKCEWTLERGIAEMARAFQGWKIPNPYSNVG